MARFYENDRNTPPRPPRPMPPGDVARRPQRPMSPPMPSGPRSGGMIDEPTELINSLKRRGGMSPRPAPIPSGDESERRYRPGSFDRRAGQGMRDALEAIFPVLIAPSRIARGAIEGGAQAVNPDFEMPDYSNAQIPGIDFIRDMMRGGNAQIPGVDFMNFITGLGLKDQGRPDSMRMAPMPRISDTQQEAEARLRAYMRQMQGGG